MNGKPINCCQCSGHGLALNYAGEPDDCYVCNGSGKNWQYNGGAIAAYYGGPFLGKENSC